MGNCKYLHKKSYRKRYFFYCSQEDIKREIILNECRCCKHKEYRAYKTAKKKSNKLAKLERQRYSILTNDLSKCYFCPNKKQDFHEAFRGRNRQKSMKWGLVVPICSYCHSKITDNKSFSETLEKIAKQVFIERYGVEKFINEFK